MIGDIAGNGKGTVVFASGDLEGDIVNTRNNNPAKIVTFKTGSMLKGSSKGNITNEKGHITVNFEETEASKIQKIERNVSTTKTKGDKSATTTLNFNSGAYEIGGNVTTTSGATTNITLKDGTLTLQGDAN